MKARVFHIVQYEKHPVTGQLLMGKNTIDEALRYRTIKKWAYIRHGRDVYTEQDEARDPKKVCGSMKPAHWHVVIETGDNPVDSSTIARWFGVEENFVSVPRGGYGAFLDCVEYLTHSREEQQELGKTLYDDKEVRSNFEWRAEIDRNTDNRLRYGRRLTADEAMKAAVLFEGKTLKECMDKDKIVYMRNLEKLKKYRLEYIARQRPPAVRINYYVYGEGGIGKGLMCRAIARAVCPDYKDDEDIFFNVGPKGVPFEGYDGQPVIIWNDRRAVDLLEELNGRGNVFNVFDTHPAKHRQHVKYGSVGLCNRVNIVNSVESYKDFLDGLAGEYISKNGKVARGEDKKQSYRRFPIIIPLHANDFDVLVNKGFSNVTEDFCEYVEYLAVAGNMRKLAGRLASREELLRKLEQQTVSIIADKHKEVLERQEEKLMEEDEALLAEFKDYGKQIGPKSSD